MANGPIGGKMSLDVSEVLENITRLNKSIKENESQWRQDASQMDDWSDSQEGLEKRTESLTKQIEDQRKKVQQAVKLKELYIEQYGEESGEVAKANDKIIRYQKELEKSQKELKGTKTSLDKLNKELGEQDTKADKAEKATEKLNDEVEKLDKSFGIGTVAIGGFIANGLTAMVSAIGNAVSSLVGLTESTREYRTMLGTLTTMADQVGASGDYIVEKWMDVNSVLGDDQAAVEGMNNLMSAGFTAEKELDGITRALEGASLQWKDTLKFEGLADSLQEWIGSDGVNLTGNFAELLERLGYNLEDVTAQTKGMTDAQRRNWAIQTLNKEGLGDVSDAYREANKDLIDYNKANSDLLNAQSLVGEAMQPFVTTVKQSAADILYSFVDMVDGVEGAGDQLLYQIGYLAGSIYKNVKSVIETMLPVVQSLIPEIIDFITENLPDLLAQGVAIVTSIINGMSQKIPEVVSKTSAMLSDIILMVVENAPALLNSALELFGQLVLAIPQIVVELSSKLPDIITTIMDGLYNGENSIYDTAMGLLGKIVDAIPEFLTSLWANLPQIIDAITQSLSDAMPKVLEGAKNLFWKIIDAIPNVLSGLASNLPQILTSILNFLIEVGPQILTGAIDLLWNIIKAIPSIVTGLGEALVQIVSAIVQFFKDNAGKILDVGKNIVSGIIDGIKSMGNAIADGAKWIYDNTIGRVLGWFGINSPSTEMRDKVGKMIPAGIVDGIKSMGSSIADGAKWIFDNTIGKVTGFFKDNSLSDIGSNIVSGITGGIKKMGSAISEATSWIADNTIGKLKGWLGIHSPSTVMAEEIGKPMAQGVATGVEENIHEVADSFTQGFKDGMSDTKKELAKAVDGTFTEAIDDGTQNVAKEVGEAVQKATTDYSKYVDASIDLASVLKQGNTEEEPSAVADKMFEMASSFGGAYGALADSIWSFISENLFNKSNKEIAETAQTMVDNLLDTIISLMNNVPKIIEGAIQFIKTFAIGLVRGIPELIKQIPKMISGMVDALITDGIPALFEVGVELVTGLIEGMFSINLWDVVKSVGSGIVNGFKKLFGIHSPSKVMADEVGKNLALGIGKGLTDNLDGVNKAIKNGVDTSVELDQKVAGRQYVTVNQTNNYSQAHSRYELYKSKRDTANAVRLAMGVR